MSNFTHSQIDFFNDVCKLSRKKNASISFLASFIHKYLYSDNYSECDMKSTGEFLKKIYVGEDMLNAKDRLSTPPIKKRAVRISAKNDNVIFMTPQRV